MDHKCFLFYFIFYNELTSYTIWNMQTIWDAFKIHVSDWREVTELGMSISMYVYGYGIWISFNTLASLNVEHWGGGGGGGELNLLFLKSNE